MEAPAPRHPDQMPFFPSTVTTTFATSDFPLTVAILITLHRTPRQRCQSCGMRRVCYFVGLGSILTSPVMCAKCSGIR